MHLIHFQVAIINAPIDRLNCTLMHDLNYETGKLLAELDD